jgi:hypothetical protein
MQPQETNPASKQEPAGIMPPSKVPTKPMTADEKKGCGCVILILLILCFLLNKCACSDSSKATDSDTTLTLKVAKLKVGLSRVDVIKRLGKPDWIITPEDKHPDWKLRTGVTLRFIYRNPLHSFVIIDFEGNNNAADWDEGRIEMSDEALAVVQPPDDFLSTRQDRSKYADVWYRDDLTGQSPSAANGNEQLGQFKYIFDGRAVQLGEFRHVELMSFIEAIYEGVISDRDAALCLLYPSKSIVSSACELQQVVGQHLIFEGHADGNESFTLAVRRDSSFESKRPIMVENYSEMRGVGMQEIMPGVALAFDGREEFTTKGGIVRKVPTFRVVKAQP